MIIFLIKRALMILPVLWVVASLSFVLVRVVPGGPFDLEKNVPPEIIANLKAKYALDRPLTIQYCLYLKRLVKGDLGVSYKYVDRSVNDILADALPVSLMLGTLALVIAVPTGLLLGTLAACNRGTIIDTLLVLTTTIGISLPAFVTGALLIMLFSLKLGWLPVALWESPAHVVLPAITLALGPIAYLTRLTRASVLEVLEKDWVRTARLKGLSNWMVVFRHVLRNALIPVVTVLGPLTAILITGSFVVEYLYAIPGMGRFFVTAVSNRDYDLVIGTALVFALLLIIANTIVDISYHFLDPRIEVEH